MSRNSWKSRVWYKSLKQFRPFSMSLLFFRWCDYKHWVRRCKTECRVKQDVTKFSKLISGYTMVMFSLSEPAKTRYNMPRRIKERWESCYSNSTHNERGTERVRVVYTENSGLISRFLPLTVAPPVHGEGLISHKLSDL